MMYSYPNTVSFKDLETTREDYVVHSASCEQIDELIEGGDRIRTNVEKYLLRKPDEEQKVYNYRKKLFTYDPVICQSINQLVTKFSSGICTVENLPNDKRYPEFWKEFRENTDSNGRNERDFIKEVFSRLIKYKTLFCLIDKTELAVEPINFAQEAALGAYKPYTVLFNPCDVLDYQTTGDKVEWVKFRQVTRTAEPIGAAKYFMTWVFVDNDLIVKYRTEVEFNCHTKCYEPICDDGRTTKVEQPVDKISEVAHNRGSTPVVMAALPEELWVANQASLLILEHIRVHNNLTYAANVAGQIQRLFTPMRETADSMVDIDSAKLHTGNDSVLIGESFSFNETSGVAMSSVSAYLAELEVKIQDLIFSNGISAAPEQLSQESGVAKAFDFANQESALTTYGSYIVEFLEAVYEQVAIALGIAPITVKAINVSGLNEFTLDSLSTKLERFERIENLKSPIANTTIKLLVHDLQKSMVPHVSTTDQNIITKETEKNFSPKDHPDITFDEAVQLVGLQVLSPATTAELLGFDPVEELNRIAAHIEATSPQPEPEPVDPSVAPEVSNLPEF